MHNNSASEEEPLLTANTRPLLASKARIQLDPLTQENVLLYPEGVVVLNETGVAILQLCDGRRTLAEIMTELAQIYGTEVEALRDDVEVYLHGLYKYSLIELGKNQQ